MVDKTTARISVYQTTPRFYLWSLPPLPKRLQLLPGDGPIGACVNWASAETFSLSAPILEFTIQDMLQEGFQENAKAVLLAWLNFDQENLLCIQMGIHSVEMPYKYQTNERDLAALGRVGHGIRLATDENLLRVRTRLIEMLRWIIEQFARKGDLDGASLAALLQRHLSEPERGSIDFEFCRKLNTLFGVGDYVEQGIDRLELQFQSLLQDLSEQSK